MNISLIIWVKSLNLARQETRGREIKGSYNHPCKRQWEPGDSGNIEEGKMLSRHFKEEPIQHWLDYYREKKNQR